jgi:excisionase family DNA binding protein
MKGESQVMLSLNEAARRLGVSRIELEALIADGEIEALRGEFLCLIPIREINRLLSANQPRSRSKASVSESSGVL